MIAVVISNEKQFQAFQVHCGGDRSRYAVFCDNPSYFGTLEAGNVNFHRLDEFLIQDRWAQVNAWGCERAAEWIRLWREKAGGGPNLAEIMFLHLGYVLVQSVKNLLLAGIVFDESKPERVLVFEGGARRRFPEFSGNVFMNYFLKISTILWISQKLKVSMRPKEQLRSRSAAGTIS